MVHLQFLLLDFPYPGINSKAVDHTLNFKIYSYGTIDKA